MEAVNKINKAKNAYDVLGIDATFMLQPDAKDKLNKIYRKMSLQVHPDKNDSPGASDAFRYLNESYKKLTEIKVNPSTSNTNYGTSYATTYAYYTDLFNMMNRKHSSNSNRQKTKDPQTKDPLPKEDSVKRKCGAKTQTDKPCKNNVKDGSRYCSKHINFDPLTFVPKPVPVPKNKCGAKTKAGDPCKKTAMEGSPFCNFHQH